MKLYNIVRYFCVSGRRKMIHRRVSLEIAQLHCRDPRTMRDGVWFDGYEAARVSPGYTVKKEGL